MYSVLSAEVNRTSATVATTMLETAKTKRETAKHKLAEIKEQQNLVSTKRQRLLDKAITQPILTASSKKTQQLKK